MSAAQMEMTVTAVMAASDSLGMTANEAQTVTAAAANNEYDALSMNELRMGVTWWRHERFLAFGTLASPKIPSDALLSIRDGPSSGDVRQQGELVSDRVHAPR